MTDNNSNNNNTYMEQPLLDEQHSDAETNKPQTNVLENPENKDSRALVISFVLMIIVGLGNKIFQVLQFVPLHNYPLFVNLLTTFIYIPASFAYIWPMIAYGSQITKEAMEVPKKVFFYMGVCDSIAGIMQSLAVNYINNGSLVILLQQAAIPISMLVSYFMLKARYKTSQYIGALIVVAGLVVVLVPSFLTKSDDDSGGTNVPVWAFVMILSCIPMCLSSVIKEKALGETEIDAVYLNGWVAIFQFLISLPLLLPSAPASNVKVSDIPSNLWDGAKCFVGINTVTYKHDDLEIDDCRLAPVYSSIYMVFNIIYNVLIILILKYGSSNVLYLAMTIMVPLGNVAFSLQFMPKHRPLKATDIVGLVVIMSGLITYRFWSRVYDRFCRRKIATDGVASSDTQSFIPTAPDSPATPQISVSTPTLGGAHVPRKASRVQPSSRAKPSGKRASDDYSIQEGGAYHVDTREMNEYE